MSTPTRRKKQRISDFFKPYIQPTVPAKRSTPSADASTQSDSDIEITRVVTTPRKTKDPDIEITRVVKTPSTSKRPDDESRLFKSTTFSPLSVPRSNSQSIPFRSPRPRGSVNSPWSSKTPVLHSRNRKTTSPSPTPVKRPSFAPIPPATQKFSRNAEITEIPDSDDDDADSVDSLESLSGLFGGKKNNGDVTSRSSSPEVDEAQLEAERMRALSAFTGGRSDALVGKDRLRALLAKQKATDFDFSSILGDHLNDQGVEEKVRRSRADYEASRSPAEVNGNVSLDRKLLATVATKPDDDDLHDGVSRLMDAVERTEALSADRVFLFFGSGGLRDWKDEIPIQLEFPEHAIPDNLWRTGDDEARARMFTSGYMADLSARGQMADDAVYWAFNTVVFEQQDDVRHAYIECLRNASASWTRSNISARDVQMIFQSLGADVSKSQDAVTIEPKHRVAHEPESRNPKYLLSALDMFQAISRDLDFLALSKLTSLVCRLAIDSELMGDVRVSVKVEDTLHVLLDLPHPDMRAHVLERILTDMGKNLQDPTLQVHLLSHILPVSRSALRARLVLAQTFILGPDSLQDGRPLPQVGYLDTLTQHVSRHPLFRPHRHRDPKNVDYTALRALTHVLDAAIADGGRPANVDSPADKVTFNRSVDTIADAVRSTLVSIIDTGASHLSRTEAKAALQALYWRLLFSVRTEPRPKKNIFDLRTGRIRDSQDFRSEQKGRDVMTRFLTKPEGHDEGAAAGNSSGSSGDPASTTATTTPEEAPADSTRNTSLSACSQASDARSETEKVIRRQLGLPD
ncbi:hypothetical protein PV08_00944 [Exophiala spinifera]|uniref:Uncharacterized protein n=1 Tax=Exophiala spinifera TaxID=91928 RepID=A0A0D2C9X5_9EURO|nr:uncharacterized protein PV08_00944 [Exophiala spinifera]KIW20369.1 hypothetical protein PV08_00944 [Exophiala spinifera]